LADCGLGDSILVGDVLVREAVLACDPGVVGAVLAVLLILRACQS
jgi:hypothetical protein